MCTSCEDVCGQSVSLWVMWRLMCCLWCSSSLHPLCCHTGSSITHLTACPLHPSAQTTAWRSGRWHWISQSNIPISLLPIQFHLCPFFWFISSHFPLCLSIFLGVFVFILFFFFFFWKLLLCDFIKSWILPLHNCCQSSIADFTSCNVYLLFSNSESCRGRMPQQPMLHMCFQT